MLTMHLLRSQADLDSELAASELEGVTPEAAPAAQPVKTLDLGDDAGWGDDGAAEAAPDAEMEDGAAGEGVTGAYFAEPMLHRLASTRCKASFGSKSGSTARACFLYCTSDAKATIGAGQNVLYNAHRLCLDALRCCAFG